jgi:hypothetical protein
MRLTRCLVLLFRGCCAKHRASLRLLFARMPPGRVPLAQRGGEAAVSSVGAAVADGCSWRRLCLGPLWLVSLAGVDTIPLVVFCFAARLFARSASAATCSLCETAAAPDNRATSHIQRRKRCPTSSLMACVDTRACASLLLSLKNARLCLSPSLSLSFPLSVWCGVVRCGAVWCGVVVPGLLLAPWARSAHVGMLCLGMCVYALTYRDLTALPTPRSHASSGAGTAASSWKGTRHGTPY